MSGQSPSPARYEYRVVDCNGHPYPSHPTFFDPESARHRLDNLNRVKKKWGPHRLERRLVVPWEPAS